MIIIQAMNANPLPRHPQEAFAQGLHPMPAVVVIGARQTGKSTLVQELTPGERRFLSIDALDAVDVARGDPDALLGGSTPIILDEIQREPELLSAVKRAIDRRIAGARSRPRSGIVLGNATGSCLLRVSRALGPNGR